ncbi:hypothetical protein SAMN06296036_108165 [Pseudobacteriovorax antillogorgiicola]|uniref:Uncharacterized protein n=1 Tax=Pseudobacteriovorax antillogorgiicola TaxID=1513793 RepID=A0A1Y6BSY0_9BACT|nr:hypothetical protein EDD56_10882 [Pseudobacteriovorax antillogorgiicola]SMF26778.1 hypothetical protein SAMN06296036_108165 [Pseudobacteriovorax antillogorgiicola]
MDETWRWGANLVHNITDCGLGSPEAIPCGNNDRLGERDSLSIAAIPCQGVNGMAKAAATSCLRFTEIPLSHNLKSQESLFLKLVLGLKREVPFISKVGFECLHFIVTQLGIEKQYLQHITIVLFCTAVSTKTVGLKGIFR